ncbi:hypothetical protein FOZ61_000676 [Perkinsus olseni]|uniref:AB hydrolase-1 domain-containing protein n=1 Tax=Perkinsus olseni TaxID=32597 RepID=A0A7J6LZD1_PEROL|nr:hypothetical protein FOZ61_000676 [Perkinsus olseni]KAF4670698.1 hypothetical protein FOL46_000684 [Perkinsus olseni]
MTEDRTTPRKQQRRLSLLQSFLVVVLPIIIASVLYDPTTVVTGLIHLHFVHWPTRIWPLDNPERDFGLVGARNYRIRSGDAELGLWHVPPADGNKGKRVVVYFHGQAGAREHGHRVELYRHLSRDMDTHVVTADLRGYGDSAGFPFVEGITEDIKTVTDWAIDNVARKLDIPIYMYGHSLGGPQAVYAALHALDREQKVNGVILESTFSSFEEVAADHISTWFLWIFPRSIRLDIIRWGFSFALQGSDFRFDTARLLQDLRRRDPSIPIVSFHGTKDWEISPHAMDKLAACVDNVNYTRVPIQGGGHSTLIYPPQGKQFLAALKDWFYSVEGSR